MINNSSIFIFTKDRPLTLRSLVESLKPLNYMVIVIDDSIIYHKENSTICLNNDIFYLGKSEQIGLIKSINADVSPFLKVLGDGNWNLGYSRNMALFYSKINKVEKVIFLDDDIEILSLSLIDNMLRLLEVYEFVGSEIGGMPDDSILGHIASSLNIHFKRMLSGGCLAFNFQLISSHFLNVYNEDWIWLYYHSTSGNMVEYGIVNHKIFDPFENFETKILFQEEGEIIVDAIGQALELSNISLLKNEPFWKEIITEREEFLNQLRSNCISRNFEKYTLMLSYLIKNKTYRSASAMASYFESYLNDQILFIEILDGL